MERRTESGAVVPFAIDARQLAKALSANVSFQFSTGLMISETLYVGYKDESIIVAEYRKPQKTAIWLDGIEDPLLIPLPGLIMIRSSRNGNATNHRLLAVKTRPTSLNHPVYNPPLPNTGAGGTCWGGVSRAKANTMSLEEDWSQFLGTRFGNHNTSNKSKSEHQDIRKLLIRLHEEKARRYPTKDLISTGKDRLAHYLPLAEGGVRIERS